MFKSVLYLVRWWRWFLRSPSRVRFGFGPDASRNWHIAMDRWQEKEPHA